MIEGHVCLGQKYDVKLVYKLELAPNISSFQLRICRGGSSL